MTTTNPRSGGHREDHSPHPSQTSTLLGPVVARVPVLFALVNIPVLVLLIWLGVSQYAHRWVVQPVGLAPLHLPTETTACMIAGVAAALVGNLLLYHWVTRLTTRLMGALTDSSDQRAQLRAILDTAADGIITCDEAKRLLTLNEAACRMFGYESHELVGQPCDVLLARSAAALDAVGTREQHVLGLGPAVEGKRKDGSRFALSLAVSKVRQAGRAIYTLIVHDLTRLKQAQHAAEAASRAKSQFLANVSHEIRTPLNGILGMAQVLTSSPMLPEQHRQLATLSDSAEKLVALLEQVLDYARLETGELQLTPAVFSLRGLLREILTEWHPAARAKGLHLVEQLPNDLPDAYTGDAKRLRQVLSHLVSNAVKFTTAGGVTLRVRRQGCLYFDVQDTGIGIAPDKLASIFTAFEQADGSSTRQHGGVGLGLSLAARLVRLMGGDIEVDSHPGHGSCFRARIPATSADDSFHEMIGPRTAVLVVSTQEEDRANLERSLRGWGWSVVSTNHGKAALTELMRGMVQGSPFGLIVWQENENDRDTADWLQQVANSPANCPVVLLRDGKKLALADWPAGVRIILARQPGSRELHDVLTRCEAAGLSLAAS